MSLNINCSEINPAYTFSLTISLCSLVCHWWLFLLFHCACGEGKRRICDRVWQVLLNAKWNRVKERYWRSVIYSFVMIRFIFIQVAFKINWSTFFFFFSQSSDLTQHFNTCCTLCSAGEDRQRPGASIWQSTTANEFRPVSPSLSPLSICWAKNTHRHTAAHV